MKKWLVSLIIISIAVLAAACGADSANSDSDKTKTNDKQETTKKKESSKEEESKKEEAKPESKDENANTTSENKEEKIEPEKPASDEKQSQAEAPSEKATEPAKPAVKTISGPQISKATFQTSNVLPITGGQVETVSGNYNPSFIKGFNSLVVRVNQYKVERVQNPTKEIDVYSPESYMQNGGYVVTLDVSIFNETTKNIMYKAEQISLVGASKSTGGSLDNFVPSNYHLTGSTADPYVFSPGKTVEGYITYMMDDAKYEDFKAKPSIAVPSPSKFDASVPKNDAAISSLSLN